MIDRALGGFGFVGKGWVDRMGTNHAFLWLERLMNAILAPDSLLDIYVPVKFQTCRVWPHGARCISR